MVVMEHTCQRTRAFVDAARAELSTSLFGRPEIGAGPTWSGVDYSNGVPSHVASAIRQRSPSVPTVMGSCQIKVPFCTQNNRCRIIIGTQKGTLILTTTHMHTTRQCGHTAVRSRNYFPPYTLNRGTSSFACLISVPRGISEGGSGRSDGHSYLLED